MQSRFKIPFQLLAPLTKTRKRGLRNLRRRKPRRMPRRRFILFCEGSKTEPLYFEAIQRKCLSAMIPVDARRGVGVPFTITTRAVKYARSHGLGRHRNDEQD